MADVFRNRCFYEFRNIHRKATVLESFFDTATLLKKRPQNRCFPTSLAKFLTTAFLHNTSGGCFCTLSTTVPENAVRRNGKKSSQNTFSIWDLQLKQITIHVGHNIHTILYSHLCIAILAVENSIKPCYL